MNFRKFYWLLKKLRDGQGLWTYRPAVYTDSHTPPHHVRTHPYTHCLHIYIHTSTHEEFRSLHITNAHTTNTVQDGGVIEKKKREREHPRGRVLSLVMLIPEQILTRPGHIFNLWPNSSAAERPARRSHSVLWLQGRRDTSPEEEEEERGERVFISEPVQCKQVGCCLSPQSGNTVVLFSPSHLQLLWKCF